MALMRDTENRIGNLLTKWHYKYEKLKEDYEKIESSEEVMGDRTLNEQKYRILIYKQSLLECMSELTSILLV